MRRDGGLKKNEEMVKSVRNVMGKVVSTLEQLIYSFIVVIRISITLLQPSKQQSLLFQVMCVCRSVHAYESLTICNIIIYTVCDVNADVFVMCLCDVSVLNAHHVLMAGWLQVITHHIKCLVETDCHMVS